eukprot:scaffold656056_cov74-Prasinocladus_malaysianus.AAC.1
MITRDDTPPHVFEQVSSQLQASAGRWDDLPLQYDLQAQFTVANSFPLLLVLPKTNFGLCPSIIISYQTSEIATELSIATSDLHANNLMQAVCQKLASNIAKQSK